jgi:DNA-binding response OmpR family regulator
VHLDPDQTAGVRQGDEKRLTRPSSGCSTRWSGTPARCCRPNQLLTQAWDDPTGIGQERVKFAVLRLRRKLGWSDPDESPIESVRGFGYRYRRPVGTAEAVEQEVGRSGRPW